MVRFVDGYLLAVRSVNILLEGYKKGFKQLTIDLSEPYQQLNFEERFFFIRMADMYRQTSMGKQDAAHIYVSVFQFLKAAYPKADDLVKAQDILMPLVNKFKDSAGESNSSDSETDSYMDTESDSNGGGGSASE